MKTKLIDHDGKKFLDVDLVQFIQKTQPFYVGKIKAKDFLKIYTVRPAQYDLIKHTALADSFPDDKEYYDYLISEDKENIRHKDFQRDADGGRVNRIARFLNDEEYALFPNTIIANCELINDSKEFLITENSNLSDFLNINNKPEYISFLRKDSDQYKLTIPFEENSILIIDGQHRLKGLEECETEIQEDYDLLIAFVIGFDRSVIAQQFYTINYEQKPVNKSLLYQLTGEFSRDVNELSFMHNIVKLLNELPDSPLYSRVKMLGITPKNIDLNAKQKMSISQAFLVDSMIRFISAKAMNTTYPPIFLKYYQNTEEHIIIVRSIARFFNAVKELRYDWETPESSVLSKGMGVGALLKVFNLLFPIIFCKDLNLSWDSVKKLEVHDYKRILSGIEGVDFSSEGEFGKTGSAGSINKIKETIIKNLTYIGQPSYQDFEDSYKVNYLPRFNTALENLKKTGQLKLII